MITALDLGGPGGHNYIRAMYYNVEILSRIFFLRGKGVGSWNLVGKLGPFCTPPLDEPGQFLPTTLVILDLPAPGLARTGVIIMVLHNADSAYLLSIDFV